MSDDVYIGSYAPSVAAQLSSLDEVAASIDADPLLSAAERAERIRGEFVSPLNALLEQAATVRPESQRLTDVHSALMSSLLDDRDALEGFAHAYETGDSELLHPNSGRAVERAGEARRVA